MESKETKKSLTSQIATGAIFTSVAVLINRASGMVLQMILVRMISVDSFGLFKLAVELSSFGIMFVTFFVGGVSASSTTRVVSLHMAAQRKDRIRSAVVASVLSVVILGIALFAVTYFPMEIALEKVFKIRSDLLPEATTFFRLFLLYIFLSSVSMVCSAALRSSELFKVYSLTESLINLLRLILIPLLIYSGYGINSIVYGWSAALLVGIIPGMWILERFTRSEPHDTNLRKAIFDDFRDMTAFGIPVFFATLSSTVYYSADVIMLGYFMPIKFVGIYSAGVMVVHSLLYLFSGLETALFPILSASLEKDHAGGESQILERGYRLLCVVTFPAAIYSFCMAPYMVRFLFGPNYLEAAVPARILSILILVWAAMPAGVLFLSTGRPEINARLGVVSAVINIALNLILIPFLGIIGAALSSVTSRSYAAVQGVRICRDLFSAPFPWRYSVGILAISVVSVISILPTYWLCPVSGSFAQTFAALAITGSLYCLICAALILKSSLLNEEDKRILFNLVGKTPLKRLTSVFNEK
jgi:O-antigen/teichoic acid export membrane protein